MLLAIMNTYDKKIICEVIKYLFCIRKHDVSEKKSNQMVFELRKIVLQIDHLKAKSTILESQLI